jgi:hypothetical protein
MKNFLNNFNSKDKSIFGIDSASFFSLFIFYSLAHLGLLFILDAVYWDDWTLYNVRSESIFETYKMAGAVFNWVAYLHTSILSLGIWLYKCLTFILMFFTGVLLWKISERISWVDQHSRYILVLLFLVLPLNWARVAIIDFPYTLCYFFFFLAWFLLGKNRPLALLFFLFSFNINSLLVFYSLPILEWYFRHHSFDLKTLWNWTVSKLDFIAIPFLFWYIKTHFFKPYGLYQGYNESFNLNNLLLTPLQMVQDFLSLKINLFLILIFFAIAVLKKWPLIEQKNNIGRFTFSGSIAFLIGCFPYWILGHVPTFFEWTSRHQLLIPLGLSLILVSVIKLSNFKMQNSIVVLVVALSIALNVQIYYELYCDNLKKKQLIELLKKNEDIRNADLIIFDDQTTSPMRTTTRFYEWNGMMKAAFGNQRHFGINVNETEDFRAGKFNEYFKQELNAGEFEKISPTTLLVKIDYIKNGFSIKNILPKRNNHIDYKISVKNVSDDIH